MQIQSRWIYTPKQINNRILVPETFAVTPSSSSEYNLCPDITFPVTELLWQQKWTHIEICEIHKEI